MAEEDEAAKSPIGVVVIHGVADAEQGRNLADLVDTLEQSSGKRLKAKSYLEVHRIEEPSYVSKKTTPQPLFVRHAMLDKRKVVFAEVFWADTTRVATGKGTALAAAFRIVFEMHYFINAMLPWNPRHLGSRLLIILLHTAALLIRGPIAGLNIVLLSVGAVYLSGLAIATLSGNPNLKVIELWAAVLLVTAFILIVAIYFTLKNAGVRFSREGDEEKNEVSTGKKAAGPRKLRFTNQIDPVPLEVCIFVVLAAFGIALLVGATVVNGESLNVCGYGALIFDLLICVWKLLSAIVLLAACIAAALMISPPGRIHRRSLWAAVGIVILQATLWATFISLPAILLVGLSALANLSICEIDSVKYDLGMTFFALAFLGLLGFGVMMARSAVAGGAGEPKENEPASLRADRLEEKARQMPRLIMSPLLLTVIVVAGLLSALAAVTDYNYATKYAANPTMAVIFAGFILAFTLGLYSILDTKAFVNVVHIARDLIDHHYAPQIGYAALLRPVLKKMPHYPRRKRLQDRVEAALKHLAKEGCKVVLFVAHSQGTVIVYEHFREIKEDERPVAGNTAVVTFGSPLQHLYAHYFHDYTRLGAKLERHQRLLATWDNLYRIDDPIGSRIDDDQHWVTNAAMERGGHTNYWVEKPVAETILKAIDRLTRPGTPS